MRNKEEIKKKKRRKKMTTTNLLFQNEWFMFIKLRGFQKVNLRVTQQKVIKRPTGKNNCDNSAIIVKPQPHKHTLVSGPDD